VRRRRAGVGAAVRTVAAGTTRPARARARHGGARRRRLRGHHGGCGGVAGGRGGRAGGPRRGHRPLFHRTDRPVSPASPVRVPAPGRSGPPTPRR
jgi:hypothetical protein